MLKFALACQVSLVAAVETEKVLKNLWNGMKYVQWYEAGAQDKFDTVMSRLKEDQTTAPYRWDLGPFMQADRLSSTCQFGDEFHEKDKVKLAHQQGTVAAVRYESVGDHPYTGFYADGAPLGLMRLSESAFTIPGHVKSNPSAAIKFFSDGIRTTNINLLIDFNDQDTWNFFPRDEDGEFKPFTNHPQPPRNECMINSVGAKFRESNYGPYSVGVSSMAVRNMYEGTYARDVGDDGDWNTEWLGDYHWPYELQFFPNEHGIPEYEEGQTPMEYLSTIKKVEDEPIFYVYARELPDDDLQLIGELFLEEDMFRSYFGDMFLYFQHDQITRDVDRWNRTNFPERSGIFMEAVKNKQKDVGLWPHTKWAASNPIPDYPEGLTAEETVLGGMLGTVNADGWTGCPFAWMFIE